MKAIVANVLFGGIFGCLSYANSIQAAPIKGRFTREKPTVSAQLSSKSTVSLIPQVFSLIDNVVTINGLQSLRYAPNKIYDQWWSQIAFSSFTIPHKIDSLSQNTAPQTDCTPAYCDRSEQKIDQVLSSPKQPYIHESQRADLVLGFQPTFWSSENQRKYWGLTTVEHWGHKNSKNSNNSENTNLSQLNYINSSPILGMGSSSLTFSGGGNQSLAKPAVLNQDTQSSREFEDFRGGITYHHGIAQQLTMGVGFVYEDNLVGFTQLTYDSNILPIKTTVSVLKKESTTALHSHVRFQPANNFVVNYYGDEEKQKFDADWGIYPGVSLTAKGNSKDESYSAGMKVAIRSNYFALSASAVLDHEQNLQWQLNSQIGSFKFAHSNNKNKSNLELSNKLLDLDSLSFQCSAFVRYETREAKQEQQEFVLWGGKLESKIKVGNSKSLWNFDLGYGESTHGQGWIANGTVALQPDLFLKVNYEEISAVSDETKIKLELSSN